MEFCAPGAVLPDAKKAQEAQIRREILGCRPLGVIKHGALPLTGTEAKARWSAALISSPADRPRSPRAHEASASTMRDVGEAGQLA
jgi:hypothetical protein